MQNARVLNEEDIKEILADYFCVSQACVIKSNYCYIILEKEESNEDNS